MALTNQRRPWRVAALVVALVLCVLAPVASTAADGPADQSGVGGVRASEVVGVDRRISGGRATSSDEDPVVAYNSLANEYLVVWVDSRHAVLRGTDIYGQRIAADGTRIGANFRISGGRAIADEASPAVVYNSVDDQFLVVWVDYRREASSGTDIYGQRISADGTRLGRNLPITGAANQASPAVGFSPIRNEYFAVWVDDRDYATGGTDVFGVLINSNGYLLSHEFAISGTTASESSPALSYDPASDQYLVVWSNARRHTTRGRDIHGRVVSATTGQLVGTPMWPAASFADERHPAVAYSPAGDLFMVVWESSSAGSSQGADIYGARLRASDGVVLDVEPRLISGYGATGGERDPVIAANPAAGEFLVVWADGRNHASRGSDIFGQRVRALDLGLPGPNFRISGRHATATERSPAITYNLFSNQYLTVRSDDRDAPTRGSDIYGRRVTG